VLTLAGGDANNNGTLDVGESWTYTGSRTISQAQVDANTAVTNTASVITGQTPGQSSNTVSTTLAYDPSLSIVKSVVSISDPNADYLIDAGDTITYGVTVTNTGDVSLTGVTIADPNATLGPVSGDLNQNGTLDVGETWSYTASYTVSQTDVDTNRIIANTATISTDETVLQSSNTVATAVQQKPGIQLVKQVSTDGTHWSNAVSTLAGVGQVYVQVIVINTGNVSETINVADAYVKAATDIAGQGGFNGAFTFGASAASTVTLAPGASLTSNMVSFAASTLANVAQVDTATVSGSYGSGAGAGQLVGIGDSVLCRHLRPGGNPAIHRLLVQPWRQDGRLEHRRRHRLRQGCPDR